MGRRRPSTKKTERASTGLGFRWPVTCAAVLLTVLVSTPNPARAQDRAQDVRAEVAALLAVVEDGGCAFMRNGSWHTAAEARKLLEHKLSAAMRNPASMTSAEHFIAKSGTSSSMSGKPYLVRCGDSPAVESGTWLIGKLAAMRTASAARPGPAPPGTPVPPR